MNSKHRKTLEAVFADPVRANIPRDDIEALLVAMGAERYEGNGSRVRFLFKRGQGHLSPPASTTGNRPWRGGLCPEIY